MQPKIRNTAEGTAEMSSMSDYSPFILVSDHQVAKPDGHVPIASCRAGYWYGPARATRAELIAKIKSVASETDGQP